MAAGPSGKAVTVNFNGHLEERWDGSFHSIEVKDATKILAVPYDMMVSGKDGKGSAGCGCGLPSPRNLT